MHTRVAALFAALIACVAVPAAVSAHPHEDGEIYVPWTDSLSEQAWLAAEPATPAAQGCAPPGRPAPAPARSARRQCRQRRDDELRPGVLGQPGLRRQLRRLPILDIRSDQPRTVVDFACNGPQNDVSVHEMGGKRFLFQSVDTAQTAEDCTSTNSEIVNGGRVGYEGIRVFDVTDPRSREFIDMIQTACGSHTHSIIPDGRRGVHLRRFVSADHEHHAAGLDAAERATTEPCEVPHKKISIIKVSAHRGEFRSELKEQPLSDDTAFNRGFQACHDIQFFMARKTALASCAGDAQLWDIKDPWNPTANVDGKHTHIYSPSTADQFEFIHSGVVSWDGKTFAIMDETGGGSAAHCFGSASTDGFYYFYDMVKPGDAGAGVEGPLHDPARPGHRRSACRTTRR